MPHIRHTETLMARALTDSLVHNLRPERGQKGWRAISDGGCRGLTLRISPTGEKAWAVRVNIGTKRRYHTVGGYPTISLAEARERARSYLSASREQISPEQFDASERAKKLTVTLAHAEYLTAIGPTLRRTTIRLKRDMYRQHIDPLLGHRLLTTIRSHDVSALVAALVAKGYRAQANRAYSEIMACLRWCEQKNYVPGIPSVKKRDMRILGAAKEQPRRRTLTEAEIIELWAVAKEIGNLTGDFICLLLLTGQRQSEVREMKWEEINLRERLWTIAGNRYKTGIDHVVPLSFHVVSLLKGRWKEGASGFVLKGRKGNAFNGHAAAMRRIRKRMGKRADFTWHDLRRSLRSGLSRLGVDERTAEMTIGHLPQGMVKAYDMHDRLVERRDALERWAAYVFALIQNGAGGASAAYLSLSQCSTSRADNDNAAERNRTAQVTLWGRLALVGDHEKSK